LQKYQIDIILSKSEAKLFYQNQFSNILKSVSSTEITKDKKKKKNKNKVNNISDKEDEKLQL